MTQPYTHSSTYEIRASSAGLPIKKYSRQFAKKIMEKEQMTNEDDLKAAAEWLYGEPTIYENEGEQK